MRLLNPWLVLGALVGLLLAYAGGRWEQHRIDERASALERSTAALDASRAQVKAVDDARLEERRWTNQQTEVANAAKKDADVARADARAADDVAGRLRKRVTELLAAGRLSGSATTPGGGAPAVGDTDALLAELFRRADERAGSLAADLDASRIAGLACERSYEALTVKP